MNTKVIPKLVQNIDEDNVILWFEKSNNYVITSKIQSDLITLYMNPDESRDSFVHYLYENMGMSNNDANAICNDIELFVGNLNISSDDDTQAIADTPNIPDGNIRNSYAFYGKTININYESELIKSLIHPQIVHHNITPSNECDVLFDVFKSNNDLYLAKNGNIVGSYKTESFHFLQGRFALELTNSIHSTKIDNWIATFHASTISNGKEAVMIIGDSGNGKSTLSVLLMAHGFDILCDDFTPLYEDNMELHRYPAATSIKKGAFDALKQYVENIDKLKTHTSGPKKVNIKYVPPILSYDDLQSSFPCKNIVYVKFDANAKSSFKPVSPDKILQTLIPDSWVSPKEKHALKFMNWLKDINSFELRYSDNDFAISKFESLFKDS